jgi:hypothetical protein
MKKSNNWINLTFPLARFVLLASLVLRTNRAKPCGHGNAGYPNVRLTLRAKNNKKERKMYSEILELYDKKGVIFDNQSKVEGCYLYETCPRKDICWHDMEYQKAEWNIIQLPYIGSEYKKEEYPIAILGLNLNEFGGICSLRDLVLDAQYSLSKGWVKIRFGNDYKEYPGTFLFHRIAVYSNIIKKYYSIEGNYDFLSSRCLAKIFDKISFLEAIKCSPSNDKNSSPTFEMYQNCPKEFLLEELAILKPRILLILGKETIIPEKLFNVVSIKYSKNENICLYTLKDNQIEYIYKVVHPTSRGGNNIGIIDEFIDFCKEI